MRPHVHVGVATGLATFATLIIVGAIWRTVGFKLAEQDKPLGKAMLYVY